MKNIGIICEYNPFHNGHARQLRAVKEQGNALCLMSGSYVQRGEPAIISKLDRAEAAVRCGADLVLELPVTYALRSAEGFADGGVEIFSRLGCVDSICFGSENGDKNTLQALAALLDTEEFSLKLREELNRGLSFPAARQKAVQALGGKDGILENPNDILAVEYCKALRRRHSAIEPMVIQRDFSYHHSREYDAPSASVLRSLDHWKDYMPEAAFQIQGAALRHSLQTGERAMLARLRAMTEAEFETIPFGAEGLWRKLMGSCMQENSLWDIIAAAKSKRYTHTRLMRMLMCAFLGIDAQTLCRPVPYIRVLAMNEQGGKLLRSVRAASQIELINIGKKPPECFYADIERRAQALYGLFTVAETEPPIKRECVRYCIGAH